MGLLLVVLIWMAAVYRKVVPGTLKAIAAEETDDVWAEAPIEEMDVK